MASIGRSLKPSSFFMSSGMRPGMPSRSMSASSISSVSSNDDHQMHFVLSGANTPISEVPASSAPRSPTAFAGLDRGPLASSPLSPRSQPIAIELPALRRFGASPVYTPPEPLSARGDLQGGYFPNHEDPTSLVRKPHPFQSDSRKRNARHQSAQPAIDGRPSGQPQAMAAAALGTTFMSDSAQYHPLRSAIDAAGSQQVSQSQTHTPVTSYMPSGVGDYQLPMGKYYPSNYESRNPRSNPPTRSTTHLGPAPLHLNNMKSDSHVPTVGMAQESGPKSNISQHARSASEAKRRLQQYQRDMVTQATQAANKVLGSHGAPRPQGPPISKASAAGRPSTSSSASSASSASTIRNLHLPGSSQLAMPKPTSPRLQPLGSPGGMVTPMDLGPGGEGGGFFSRGQPMSGPDAEREQEEVRMALARDDDMGRQGVSTPPALEITRVAAT